MAKFPIPHSGVRDREDYLSDEEVESLANEIPNLFIWASRSIENEILSPPLLARTLERAGRPSSEDEVRQRLRELSDRQRDSVLADLVDARLRHGHSYIKAGTTPLERRKHHLEEVRRVAKAKLDAFDDVHDEVARELDERWDTDFLTLADGKRLLAEFVESTGYRSPRDLLSAMTQTAHDHPELMPPGFVKLRATLREMLPATAPPE